MNILFVTTTNLATNPRLCKEIKLAQELNIKVNVIAFKQNNWSKVIERDLTSELLDQSKITYLSVLKSDFHIWLFIKSIRIFFKIISKIFVRSTRFYALSLYDTSIALLLHFLFNYKSYNLIIGHNPGSFYPVFKLSKQKKIPFALDIEDYHPSETNNEKIKKKLESIFIKCLPSSQYYSFASPLIGEKTNKLIKKNDGILINNSFSKSEFLEPFTKTSNEKLKIVWFSQNIAQGRGLELVIPILKKLAEQIELHLIGNLYNDFNKQWILPNKNFIIVHKPCSQKILHNMLAKFDIGLALELSSSNNNRDICLTNKIFAYAQSGLYIMATDTSAQLNFIQKNPEFGIVCNQIPKDIERSFMWLINEKKNIRLSAGKRYVKGYNLSWENESKKLKHQWFNLNLENGKF